MFTFPFLREFLEEKPKASVYSLSPHIFHSNQTFTSTISKDCPCQGYHSPPNGHFPILLSFSSQQQLAWLISVCIVKYFLLWASVMSQRTDFPRTTLVQSPLLSLNHGLPRPLSLALFSTSILLFSPMAFNVMGQHIHITIPILSQDSLSA